MITVSEYIGTVDMEGFPAEYIYVVAHKLDGAQIVATIYNLYIPWFSQDAEFSQHECRNCKPIGWDLRTPEGTFEGTPETDQLVDDLVDAIYQNDNGAILVTTYDNDDDSLNIHDA